MMASYAFGQTCKRCGKEGLTWMKREGKYRLTEIDYARKEESILLGVIKMKLHECTPKKEG